MHSTCLRTDAGMLAAVCRWHKSTSVSSAPSTPAASTAPEAYLASQVRLGAHKVEESLLGSRLILVVALQRQLPLGHLRGCEGQRGKFGQWKGMSWQVPALGREAWGLVVMDAVQWQCEGQSSGLAQWKGMRPSLEVWTCKVSLWKLYSLTPASTHAWPPALFPQVRAGTSDCQATV